jgi:hypothetical protein
MIERREFILGGTVITAAAMVAHRAAAQEAGVKRVGVILQGGPWYAVVEGLREGLSQSGYVEGKQYFLDIRDTRGDLTAAEDPQEIWKTKGST